MRVAAVLFVVAFGVWLVPSVPHAQPGVTSSPASPAGLWEGTIRCPAQMLPFQLVVVPDGSSGFQAVLVSPSQGFSTDVQLSVANGMMDASGPMPGNVPARLSGPIANGMWRVTLSQGGMQCQGTANQSTVDGKWLRIAPAYQVTPMWCWLTVGQMVFEHFGVIPKGAPAFAQCGIMQVIYSGSPQFAQCANSCGACAMLGGGSSREVEGMLVDFPHRLAILQRKNVPRLFATTSAVLTSSEMIDEIKAERPVVIAISPNNSPMTTLARLNPFQPAQHVALVVGYLQAKGKTWYRVNDPFPFQAARMIPPYVAAGGIAQVNPTAPASVSYWITEDALKTQLRWSESFLVRQDGVQHP